MCNLHQHPWTTSRDLPKTIINPGVWSVKLALNHHVGQPITALGSCPGVFPRCIFAPHCIGSSAFFAAQSSWVGSRWSTECHACQRDWMNGSHTFFGLYVMFSLFLFLLGQTFRTFILEITFVTCYKRFYYVYIYNYIYTYIYLV